MPFLRHVAFALLGLSLAPSALSFSPGFPYGSQKVRGVNLGGWLVLEPWITPSLFDNTGNSAIVDEWTFGQHQNRVVAEATLQTHWNTWITESDFANIAAAGLNHVRLPIGYWAFEVGPGEPYIQGQLPYLQKAVTWAGNHGLKLIIDLHGAPGSQNGFDNSGQRMSFPHWQSNQTNIDRTNAVMKTIATMFTSNPNVIPIIAPLNEPAGFDGAAVLNATRDYWGSSYQSIRYPHGQSQSPSNIVELIHDAFQPPSYWKGFEVAPNFQGVAMDTHIYQVFSDSEVAMSYQQHIKTACQTQSTLSSYDLWIIVGEWASAPTDCAKYLNGRGVGARYDGSYSGSTKVGSCSGMTGSASSFSSSYKTFLGQFWEAQVISYEKSGDGWIQWTWKAENADDWSYEAGLANGWIPKDPTKLQYPNICN
ncbi:glycoside hydrolase family 5 protein [Serpula lacrymans var. lacrymans S7.3]|uniref:Glycoside hydrolase family 5 protein n=2 Tax=Serpula lacrymans var. lacrymans TaxID=341189 RepID=F8QET0_SERL3|nr:glycoside hydrolase family 5 protein [Serpula lacrymans var. lacrymans S7.9]EGN93093.1 glycoside hydrolase family 5 protein [Serpula lacrymans var. lacrymans S7.3]EGO30988.1 glycoside hydrolase family 5 protein [Serpula lacrymans var. lacrymans S7.9]